MNELRALLAETADAAADFLGSIDARPIGATAELDDLRARFGTRTNTVRDGTGPLSRSAASEDRGLPLPRRA